MTYKLINGNTRDGQMTLRKTKQFIPMTMIIMMVKIPVRVVKHWTVSKAYIVSYSKTVYMQENSLQQLLLKKWRSVFYNCS